jgi:four helix bundle protein
MTQEIINRNPIVRSSFELAILVNDYSGRLRELSNYDLARQLFRSGTSIGANTWEAQNSESKADFIHKMKIAAKEANETQFWLLLCEKNQHQYPDCTHILSKLVEVQKLLSSILATSKKTTRFRFLLGMSYFF